MCRKTQSSGRSAARACRAIARAAAWRPAARRGRFDLIVTHHPLVSCWTELFCRRRRTCPHVAFAFNFTGLPVGLRRTVMRRAFATVDRFIVFSEFERTLYADYFRLPVERFEMVHWGVREPEGLGMRCVASRGFEFAGDLRRRQPGARLRHIAGSHAPDSSDPARARGDAGQPPRSGRPAERDSEIQHPAPRGRSRSCGRAALWCCRC